MLLHFLLLFLGNLASGRVVERLTGRGIQLTTVVNTRL